MVNKVILLGNLGKDPLIRRTEGGLTVATFSIATSETYKDKEGNKQKKTEWHNIVMWSHLAEIAEKFLKKGAQVYLEGRLTTRSYEQDSVTKYITEVVVNNLVMMGSKGSGHETPLPPEPVSSYSKPQTSAAMVTETTPAYADNDDDGSVDELPF